MKKSVIIALALILTLSLAACGRREPGETSAPTTAEPSTNMTILPDPTIGTNIPDPDVDTSMPMYTDGTDMIDGTESATTGRSANRNGH